MCERSRKEIASVGGTFVSPLYPPVSMHAPEDDLCWARPTDIHSVSLHSLTVLLMSSPFQGHVEFFICDAKDLDDPNGVVTQECFNKYPLTRSAGDDVNSPIDPAYPGRYYANPECTEHEADVEKDPILYTDTIGFVMTMNYDLPADLTCTHCTIQMVYCECALHACIQMALLPSVCLADGEGLESITQTRT